MKWYHARTCYTQTHFHCKFWKLNIADYVQGSSDLLNPIPCLRWNGNYCSSHRHAWYKEVLVSDRLQRWGWSSNTAMELNNSYHLVTLQSRGDVVRSESNALLACLRWCWGKHSVLPGIWRHTHTTIYTTGYLVMIINGGLMYWLCIL